MLKRPLLGPTPPGGQRGEVVTCISRMLGYKWLGAKHESSRFNAFYQPIKSLRFVAICMFKHQDL